MAWQVMLSLALMEPMFDAVSLHHGCHDLFLPAYTQPLQSPSKINEIGKHAAAVRILSRAVISSYHEHKRLMTIFIVDSIRV